MDFTQKNLSLKKTNVSLQKNLQEATTAIRYIRSARKSDNRKIANTIDAINKTLETLAPLPQNLETMASDIKLYDQNFSKELGSFSKSLEGLRNSLIKLQADILYLASAKTDKKAFDLALQKTRMDIYKRIVSLENRLNKLGPVETPPSKKSQTKSSQKSASVPPESKPDSNAKTSQNTATTQSGSVENAVKESTTPKPVSEDKSSLPKPGSFIEQDIK